VRIRGRLAIRVKAIRLQPTATVEKREGNGPVPGNVDAAKALPDATEQTARHMASD
jgi:hypothetical protein